MIEKADARHLIKFLSIAFIFISCAMILAGINLQSFLFMFKEPVNLENVEASDIRSGLRVEADILYVYDFFAYTTQEGSVISKEFLIDADSEYYMAVNCDGTTMKEMDALMELYEKLMYSEYTQADLDAFQSIHVKGTICRLSGETLDFYNQYIESIGFTNGEEEFFLPYSLNVGIDSDKSVDYWALTFLGIAVFMIIGIIVLVKALSNKNHETLDKYYETVGNKEAAKERLELFYKSGIPVQGTRINKDYFLMFRGDRIYFAMTEKLLWVYENTMQQRINGIPVYMRFEVVVNLTDGKGFKIPMKNKKSADELTNYIMDNVPELYFGYSDDYKAIYNSSHRNELIQYRDEKRDELHKNAYDSYDYPTTE